MKYLITGGCGFLGSNIAAKILADSKGDLVIIDSLQRVGSINNLEWLKTKGSFVFRHADIRNTIDVTKFVKEERPDVIFHLAGQVAMTTSIANTRFDFETNVLGSLNILEAVRDYSPDSIIVYSSTNKVYGDLEWETYSETDTRYVSDNFLNGFPESITLDFHSPYGCSKGAADQYMLDFSRIFGLKTVVFRHSSMFGGRQFSTYDQGWIGWFCQKAIEIKQGVSFAPFTVSGNGKQVRDVLYADDMVDLYLRSVDCIKVIKGQAFNIGGGMNNSLSLLELFSILENELNIQMKYVNIDPRESDQKVFVADIRKAESLIGWTPKISKESGLKKMIEWVQSNGQ